MTPSGPLAIAIERREWELVALRLLVGVSVAASLLPPQSLNALVEVLSGAAENGGRGDSR
jgi:hypothetical protein